MAFTINGCGTRFYGEADPHPDGSYIVTNWFVMIYLPLVPLGSMRVLPMSQDHLPWYRRGGQQFRSMKVPLWMPHVVKGWGVTLGIFVLLAILGRH